MAESVALHLDKDTAADMAVNAIIKYLHECGVEGDQQKRKWIQNVFDRVNIRELAH